MSEIPLPPAKWRYPKTEDFEAGGERIFRQLVEFGGLKPTDSVVDAGCGPGRVARHLVYYLDPDTGSYDGFDVMRQAVDWSREKIEDNFSHFHFEHAEVSNERYGDESGDASEYEWPYQTGSRDFVFAASLMTHLLPKDHENYIRQTARVLKPGGRCWISYFLLNRESRARIKRDRPKWSFPHRYSWGCRVQQKNRPANAVAYDEKQVRRTFEKNGLTIIGIRYGWWCRKNADHHQDAIVAVKN